MSIFTFNDITALDDYGLQCVLRNTDYYTLIYALKAANEAVRNRILNNISKKIVVNIQTALENSKNISEEDSEKAQNEILKFICDIRKNSFIAINGDFTFPVFPDDKVKNKVGDIVNKIEEACESVNGRLYFWNEAEDDVRKGFEAFQNRRDELARIRSISASAYLLPLLAEFLEEEKIEELSVRNCDLISQWQFLENFRVLKEFEISYSKFIPENIGKLQSLEKISIYPDYKLEALPESIGNLNNLRSLYIYNASLLKQLPESFSKLQSLVNITMHRVTEIKNLSIISKLKNISSLELYNSSDENIDWIADLQSLTKLVLNHCDNINMLPESLGNLINLSDLSISGLPSLTHLPESICNLQSLTRIFLDNCKNLKTLPENIGNLKNLTYLHIYSMPSLNHLPESISNLQSLENLLLYNIENIKILPENIGNLNKLSFLEISDLPSLEKLPESVCNLQCLEKLKLEINISLTSLPESIGNLKNLTYFNIENSINIKHLPESAGNLKSLKYVNLLGTGITSVPESISSVRKFIDSKHLVIFPSNETISYQAFVNSYYRLADTIFNFNNKAIREGLLALEDELGILEKGFFKTGVRLVVDGCDCVIIRELLSISIERENDFYRKRLMNIAMEGILGILGGDPSDQLLFRLNLMVDIKDNPIDAAYKKYLSGDREAFYNIDFSSAIKPETERDEIKLIKRALALIEKACREGHESLECELNPEAIAAEDVFEYGINLIVEGRSVDVWMGLGVKYIDAVLSKLVNRETDPVRKNIAAAKKEAVMSIYNGDNPRILVRKIAAYFNESITKELLKDFDN